MGGSGPHGDESMASTTLYPSFSRAGYKSRLLFAKIAMAIWFQVSGFRCQVSGMMNRGAGT